ncbi:MAG: GNAT family N-acetyltransferase [Clostridiales bacterium]|nr:GNAT family N-acetyltransferase [Clostridiales bacterium]
MQLIESIRELSLEEIRDIYNRYLYNDFPFDERKPLDRIEKSMRDGQYICLGAWDKDGNFLAYAFFVVIGRNVLLDYYAVVQKYRGTGIGTSFLPQAASKTDAECLIIEIEDPGSAMIRKKASHAKNAGISIFAPAVSYRMCMPTLLVSITCSWNTPSERLTLPG